jgi:uncharacterized protein
MMDAEEILSRYYDPSSRIFDILVTHSRCVAEKAVRTAEKIPELRPDLQFIAEAAMLHDIGIIRTNTPKLDCHGEFPYVCHGFLGREMLEEIGLARHALVAERHTGTGITVSDIVERDLGLPIRDMVPMTIEEEIICYADKFFSKNHGQVSREKTMGEVLRYLSKFGEKQVKTFTAWAIRFGDLPCSTNSRS